MHGDLSLTPIHSLDPFGRRWDTRDDSAEILFQSFLRRRGGHREQFWHIYGRPLFDVVHPVFPLPTAASPTLQGGRRMILERMSSRVFTRFCCSLNVEVDVGVHIALL